MSNDPTGTGLWNSDGAGGDETASIDPADAGTQARRAWSQDDVVNYPPTGSELDFGYPAEAEQLHPGRYSWLDVQGLAAALVVSGVLVAIVIGIAGALSYGGGRDIAVTQPTSSAATVSPSTVTEPPSTVTEPPSTVTVPPTPPPTTSAPVTAPPGSAVDQLNNERFILLAQGDGFVINDNDGNPHHTRAHFIEGAHQACGLFENGYSREQIVNRWLADSHGITRQQITELVDLSTDTYCPQYN